MATSVLPWPSSRCWVVPSAEDGLDEERLERLRGMLRDYVDRGELPGAVAIIQRKNGKERCLSVGYGDVAGTAPFASDTIVRIGSMTKPILSVLAMMFVEEGKLRLSDSAFKWLPELKRMGVLTHARAKLTETVSAEREISVEHLLTHRPGFATALIAEGELGQAVQVLSGGLGQRAQLTPDAWISLLGGLPLAAQPGAAVINGFATDVLGVLLARLTDRPLPELLHERLLGPLGMTDTSFQVPPDKLGRLSAAYSVGWLSGRRSLVDDPANSRFATVQAFPSGSGGLVSTASDFLKFARMLRDGGILDDQRFLSRKTIELMTTNFLSTEQRRMPFFGVDFWADRGLGLGVYVLDDLARHGLPASLGQYGWGGAFATSWFNDPAEELCAILMTQVAFPAVTPQIRNDFEAMVYQAIAD